MKRFIIILLCCVFLLSFVSAQKEFNKNIGPYGQIEVDDWLFFSKADYRLTDYGCSLINCWAEGEYKLYKKTHLFQGLYFKDRIGKIKTKDYDFFILVNESYNETIKQGYESCSNPGNGTVCDWIENGTRTTTKYREVWKPYTKKTELELGEGKWRLESKRNPNEPLDFILQAHDYNFTEWAWWNSTWQYKRQINISKDGNPTNNDFQALINITYDSDMQADFSDLRFTNAAEDTELAYYIDDKVDSTWATVFVRLPTNVTSTNQTVAYMYYSNTTTVTSNSNPNSTFNLWDEFNSANTSKWNYVTGSLSVSGGIATLNNDMIVSYDNWSYDGRMYEMWVTTSMGDATGNQNPNDSTGTDTADRTFWGVNCGKQSYFSINDGSSTGSCSGANPAAPLGTLWTTVRANASNVLFMHNNSIQFTTATNIPDANLNFGMRSWGGADMTLDWVRVRSFNDTPLNVDFGAEEIEASVNITRIFPPDDHASFNYSNSFQVNVTATGSNLSNVTLYLDDVINETNTSGINNVTYTFFKNLSPAQYDWKIQACDTTGLCDTTTNWNITVFQIEETNVTYTDPVLVTTSQSFVLNYSGNGSTMSNGKFFYDGTEYAATITNFSNGNFSINSTITVPAVEGTYDWYFNFDYEDVNYNSTLRNQSLSGIVLGVCNATLNTTFISFEYYDEKNASQLNGTVNGLTITYYLGDATINKTLSYTNTTANESIHLCFSPAEYNVTALISYNYAASGYPQRTYVDTKTLTNASTTQYLWLLETAVGLYSPFTTVNSASNVITAVDVTITTTVNGSTTQVAGGQTDGSGLISFFLDPDVSHTATFTKSGYSANIFTFFPVTDNRLVIMGSTTAINGSDIALGLQYNITPTQYTLVNDTSYLFEFNTSGNNNVTFMSMVIQDVDGNVIYSGTNSGLGSLSTTINTLSNTTLVGYYGVKTNTEVLNFTKTWKVTYLFTGDYSLQNQLELYLDYAFNGWVQYFIVMAVLIGTMMALGGINTGDSDELKIFVIVTEIWIFSAVSWLNVPGVVATTALTEFAEQWSIAILSTIAAVFYSGRRIFI